MRKNVHVWTTQEDAELTQLVKHSIQAVRAFRLFHENHPELSVAAIASRWYNTLKKRPVCMTIISKPSLWKRVKSLFS